MSEDLVPFTFNTVLKENNKKEPTKDEKKSLIDFQEQLTKDLNNLPSSDIQGFILLKLSRDSQWLMRIKDIKETSVLPAVSHIGMTQPWIVGIANFKGTVGTVMDMKHFLLGSPSNTQSTHAILLSKKHNLNLALLWPHIERMANDTSLNIVESESKPKWVKQVWQDEKGSRWNELDIEGLITSKEVMDAFRLK